MRSITIRRCAICALRIVPHGKWADSGALYFKTVPPTPAERSAYLILMPEPHRHILACGSAFHPDACGDCPTAHTDV